MKNEKKTYSVCKESVKGVITDKPKAKGKKRKKIISGVIVAITVFSVFKLGNGINTALNDRDTHVNAVNETYYSQVSKYDYITKDVKEFMEQRNCTKPLDIFATFNEMLWRGDFSENHEFKYGNKNLMDIPYNAGIDVFDGEGVCRNIADFLSKLFNEFGYISFTTNVLTNNDITIDKQMGVERNVGNFEESGLGNYFTDSYGNHVITVVIDGNDVYFLDSTNLAVYKLKDKDQLEVLNGNGVIEIKPNSEYILNGIDVNEMKLLKDISNGNYNFSTKNEVYDAFEKAKDDELITTSEYEKFYKDEQSDYENINNFKID